MNLSAWCIRHALPTSLLFIVLLLMGLFGFKTMKIQNYPDVDLPTIVVRANLPGASSSQLENDVARKLENAVAVVQGVKHIRTTILGDVVNIMVEFRLEKTAQQAMEEVRDVVSRARSDLPPPMREPTVSKIEFSGLPILTFTVSSTRLDEEELSWFIDSTVSQALLGAPGVGAVQRVGGLRREVQLRLDQDRLTGLNVTAAEVSRQLRLGVREEPGGRSDLGGREQVVRTVPTLQSAQDLSAMTITLDDGRRLRLGDVAEVVDTVGERRSEALLDGRRVVAIEVSRSRGAGEVEMAGQVRKRLAELQAHYPDIAFTEAFNFVDAPKENYEGSMRLLYEGALLATVIVYFFLRNWRATFVAAVAMPLSVIPAFFVMHAAGFTLNVVTLLALSLVVGILVDDAIVEVENIMRHLQMGKSPLQAAFDATREIGLAVVATTATLIAVFLPTAFMTGMVGKFFVQFGWTAAIAVFFSLVVARMLTPILAARLLQPLAAHIDEPFWMQPYLRWITWCLAHRGWTSLISAVLVIICFQLMSMLPTGFLPPDDLSQTQVNLLLPPGTPLERTREVAETARQLLSREPHVKLVYTSIGAGNAGGNPMAPADIVASNKASLTIKLSPRAERVGVNKQMLEARFRELLSGLPGTRVGVGLGASSERYVLVLSGEDGEALKRHAGIVEAQLRGIPGIGDVTSGYTLTRPELVVTPDLERAADLGVTAESIAQTLRVATAGDYDQNLAKMNVAQRQIPLVVRLRDEARKEEAALASLTVKGRNGPVMLSNVATLSVESGPSQIDRYDRLRNINFDVELNGMPLGSVEKAVLALPSVQHLPPGIIRTTVGDAEAMGELFASFGVAMGAAVICIYMVLVLLFKDFAQPLTILSALLLSIPGAFWALFITRTALSLPAMIGLIMLMGIATKNAILLVDYASQARREDGLSRTQALIAACRKRARAVIMTTVAMGAGMLPIAMGIGVDASFRAPMAIVIIGGLISSTFMSLLVVPVIFTFVDDADTWVRRLPPLSSGRTSSRQSSSPSRPNVPAGQLTTRQRSS